MDTYNLDKYSEIIKKFVYPVCVIDMKDDMKLLSANESFYQLTGYSEEDMKLKFANSITHLFDAYAIKEINQYLFQKENQSGLSLEQQLRRKNGENIWVINKLNCITVCQNIVYMVFCEISQYKQEEFNVSSMHEKMNFIRRRLAFDIFEYDLSKDRLYLHEIDFLKSHYAVDYIEINTLVEDEIIHKDYKDFFYDNLKKLQCGEKEVVFEFKALHATKNYRWFKAYVTLIEEESNKVAFGVLQDIDLEKEMTYKYLNETQFYQAIISHQSASCQVDLEEDKILKMSGVWVGYNEIIGTTPFSELFHKYIKKVVYLEDRSKYIELIKRDNLIDAFNNGTTYFETDFRRIGEENKVVWMKVHIHIFRNPNNSHIMSLFYLQDISAQKRKESISVVDMYLSENDALYENESIELAITRYLQHPSNANQGMLVIVEFDYNDKMEDKNSTKLVTEKMESLLAEFFRKCDIISHMQGNQYIIFLKAVSNNDEIHLRFDELAEKLYESDPNILYNMGVCFVLQGQSYNLIYRHASLALLLAKESGKNTYEYYYDGNDQKNENVSQFINKVKKSESFSKLEKKFIDEEATEFNSFLSKYGDMSYLIHPETYELLEVNEAFCDRIGMSNVECLGVKCYKILYGRDTPCPFCARANWNTERFYFYRNYNERLEQEFLIKNKLVTWNGEPAVLAVAVDLSSNKNIINSFENTSTENNYILSGLQHLQAAPTKKQSVECALENIANFFKADCVRCCRYNEEIQTYEFCFEWMPEMAKGKKFLDENEISIIRNWLRTKNMKNIINIEDTYIMLSDSYEMHQLMINHKIENEQWVPFEKGNKKYLFLMENINANFSNTSFLESFIPFIIDEWEKRDLDDEFVYGIYHDKLTNVLNRSCYEKDIVDFDVEGAENIAVVIANVDHFKDINAEKSFDFGNFVLTEFAKNLKDSFKEYSVYRLSGDEFLVLMKNTDILEIENRIAAANKKITKDNIFTASFGYAWDNVEKNINELSALATNTMNSNKKIHYDTQKYDGDSKRLLALNQLMHAIDNGNFIVYLQAKYDNKENDFVGAEALVRYRHEEYGIISPAKFIDNLEKNNLIRYVDIYVFETVCRYLEKWKKQKRKKLCVSFNLSRLTLMETDITETIEGIFNKYDIDKDSVEIEITENDTMVGKAVLYQNAYKLHLLGYKISLDDFGTKHTNLSILSDIHVDVLKIDKSLIHALSHSEKEQVILKNIIHMCDELSIKVIAEGVETPQQEDMLKQLGCYLIQGYLYSKPIYIDEFERKFIN